MTVIPQIIENKKKIISKKKSQTSLNEIKKKAEDFVSTKTDKYRFQETLQKGKNTKLIAEYKPASPSQGNISNLTIENVISIYNKSPVDMISVLTEESYFKSNLDNFIKAEKKTDKPLLRKDFVIDEYMIYEAALNNASSVLLITGITPDIEEYYNIANELGMDSIIECHNIKDIEAIVDYNPPIIGINNRNLQNLKIDLETTRKLSDLVPNYMISESGVKTPEDAKLLKEYGADAILIGTSILEKNDEEKISQHIRDISNILK